MGETLTLSFVDFGFPDELYKIKFESSGDHALSERIVELYKAVRRATRFFLRTNERQLILRLTGRH